MRLGEHDQDYIWLRQSATFVVNGQTRTVEIAIPVRRGCTPEELETLLDEADAGMARLSRHLDTRIAEQAGTAPPPVAATPTTAPTLPPVEPAPRPAPATTPSRPAAPPPSLAERPASTSPRTSPPPTPPQRPTPPAASPRPAPPAPAATPATSGAPLTIPEFITAISAELGYNARQAMDELGVRTLSGLNLREALETLRRKHLRSGTGTAPVEPSPMASAPTPPAPIRPAPAPSPEPPAPPRAHYFEEEDDGEYTFDLEGEDDFAPPAAALGASLGDEPPLPDADDFDLADELPDLDALPPPPEEPSPAPPPARSRSAANTRTPPPRATSTAPTPSAASAFTAPPTTARSTGPLAGAEHMRGLPRLGQLRAIPVGGAATPYQQNAYQHLVVSQLGEAANMLVAGVWRASPAQLGADQLDALLRWAKEDAFYDEAQQVLAALQAERARAHAASETTATNGATPAAPPSAPGRASAPRRAASPRSRDTTREAEGGR